MTPVRIVMIDDHPSLCDGLRRIMDRTSDLRIIGTAYTPDQAIPVIAEQRPGLILLDLHFTCGSGLDLMQTLHSMGIHIPTVILSADAHPHYVQQAIQLGAAGYLSKTLSTSSILAALRGIARGERNWFPDAYAVEAPPPTPQPRTESMSLTARERELLQWMCRGATDQQIATAMAISERAVRYGIQKICQKLNVTTRIEAAVLAAQQNLIPLPDHPATSPATDLPLPDDTQ